jgi:hypothetical protein
MTTNLTLLIHQVPSTTRIVELIRVSHAIIVIVNIKSTSNFILEKLFVNNIFLCQVSCISYVSIWPYKQICLWDIHTNVISATCLRVLGDIEILHAVDAAFHPRGHRVISHRFGGGLMLGW